MLQLTIAFDSRRWSAGGFYYEEHVAERFLFWDFVTFPPFGNHVVDLALDWDVTSDAVFKCCAAIY